MDVLRAILLLTALPGTFEPIPSEDAFPEIRDAVHQIAIQWEILDPRETSYIFAKRSEFGNDLDLLRRRVIDFRDAPRLDESERLPERKLVNELLAFNRAYRKHLTERHSLEQDRAEVIEGVLVEVDDCYKIWDALRDARTDFYYVTVRRQAMARLKCLVGEDAWHRGEWPPPVPTWRFEER